MDNMQDQQNPLDVGNMTYDSRTGRWVPKAQPMLGNPSHQLPDKSKNSGVGVSFGGQVGEAINSIPWQSIPLLGGGIKRTQQLGRDIQQLPQNIKTFQDTPFQAQPYVDEFMKEIYSNPSLAMLSDQKNPTTAANIGQKAQAMAMMGGMGDIQPIQGGWVQTSQANPNLQPYIDAAKQPADPGAGLGGGLAKGNLTPEQITQYHAQTLPKSQIETAIANGQFRDAQALIDKLPMDNEYKSAAQQLLQTIMGTKATASPR